MDVTEELAEESKRPSGAVIVLLPRDPGQWAIEGGTKPSRLHCTLHYLGLLDNSTINADKVKYVLGTLADSWRPIEANILGVQNLGDEDPPATVYRLTSAPSVIRAAIKVALPEIPPSTFPNFTPHMTQGYGTEPNTEHNGKWVVFDRLGLWWGNDQFEFPLDG